MLKLIDVGATALPWTAEEAAQAMLACGFDAAALEDMEILAEWDARGGVIELAVYAGVLGTYCGNNADGWNPINSLQEVAEYTDPADINREFGDGAANRRIFRAFIARNKNGELLDGWDA